MIKCIFSDVMPGHQESVLLLKQHLDLQRYFVSVSLQKLTQISDKGTCDGAEGNNKDKLFKYVCNIAKSVHQSYAPCNCISDSGIHRYTHILYICAQ